MSALFYYTGVMMFAAWSYTGDEFPKEFADLLQSTWEDDTPADTLHDVAHDKLLSIPEGKLRGQDIERYKQAHGFLTTLARLASDEQLILARQRDLDADVLTRAQATREKRSLGSEIKQAFRGFGTAYAPLDKYLEDADAIEHEEDADEERA